MSSNPFRKKALRAIDTSRTGSPKSSMRTDDAQASGDRKKTVKKVRVLSPPPLSPDSPEWPFDAPQPPGPLSSNNYNYTNYNPSFDPFNGASTDESDRDSMATPPPPPPPVQQQQQQQQKQQQQHLQDGISGSNMPPNPFSKTLQDIEGSKDLHKERQAEGEALKAANEGRKSLNVDSFKRLLMTGSAGNDGLGLSTDREDETLAAKTNISSTAQINPAERRNDEYSGSSAESSDSQDEDEYTTHTGPSQRMSNEKKGRPPPPPPSSRHGKSLKQQQEMKDAQADAGDAAQGLGKPLPAAPIRRSMDDDESPFDIEAAGKIPSGDTETDAELQTNSLQTPQSARKSAPAPPPPRGHAKSDSKSFDNETPRRTSSDGLPTRSDSTRSTGTAPAPPPPRRPHLAPKQTSSSSPSISSSNNIPTSPTEYQTDQEPPTTRSSLDQPNKPSTAPPPRPPPARQPSTRRPASITSIDAPSRRISLENKSRDGGAPPPPPPPRHRGSSPNTDGSGRKVSSEAAADSGKSADILADLDALRREVDALRGQIR